MLNMPSLLDFAAAIRKQRRAVKAVLLDQVWGDSPCVSVASWQCQGSCRMLRAIRVCMQSFSAGVGNWVADEVLFQARVHPEQPANSLTAEQVGPQAAFFEYGPGMQMLCHGYNPIKLVIHLFARAGNFLLVHLTSN